MRTTQLLPIQISDLVSASTLQGQPLLLFGIIIERLYIRFQVHQWLHHTSQESWLFYYHSKTTHLLNWSKRWENQQHWQSVQGQRVMILWMKYLGWRVSSTKIRVSLKCCIWIHHWIISSEQTLFRLLWSAKGNIWCHLPLRLQF